MSKFSEGDMVVLISGSMRMAVESIDGETVSVVWCHEGKIGRDDFHEKLLNKWEFRGNDERSGQGGGGFRGNRDRDDRGGPGGGGGFRGNRDRDDRGGPGGGGGYRGNRDRDDNAGGGGFGGKPGRDSNPRAKTGWDGKPREKKFYRDDD